MCAVCSFASYQLPFTSYIFCQFAFTVYHLRFFASLSFASLFADQLLVDTVLVHFAFRALPLLLPLLLLLCLLCYPCLLFTLALLLVTPHPYSRVSASPVSVSDIAISLS